jgi:hypothetical protein
MLNFAIGSCLFFEINVSCSWMYHFEAILFINIDANVCQCNGLTTFDVIKSKSDVASFLMQWPAQIKKIITQTVFLQKL